MAQIMPLDKPAWDAWVATRPPVIQEMCRKWPPNLLYRMKDTGHRVFLLSYAEDGTVTVAVTRTYNLVVFERRVFGVDPTTLQECELPGPDEEVGAVLTSKSDVQAFIDEARSDLLATRGQAH